jgi:hypothetical protein
MRELRGGEGSKNCQESLILCFVESGFVSSWMAVFGTVVHVATGVPKAISDFGTRRYCEISIGIGGSPKS